MGIEAVVWDAVRVRGSGRAENVIEVVIIFGVMILVGGGVSAGLFLHGGEDAEDRLVELGDGKRELDLDVRLQGELPDAIERAEQVERAGVELGAQPFPTDAGVLAVLPLDVFADMAVLIDGLESAVVIDVMHAVDRADAVGMAAGVAGDTDPASEG